MHMEKFRFLQRTKLVNMRAFSQLLVMFMFYLICITSKLVSVMGLKLPTGLNAITNEIYRMLEVVKIFE